MPPLLVIGFALLTLVFLLALGPGVVVAEFPKDLVPMNIVTGEVSRAYPAFRGLPAENSTAPPALEFQRMLRINQTLYVAARDHVYSFDLGRTSQEGLVPRTVLTWRARASDMQNCAMRGKRPDECHNFIRVLVPQGDRMLFVCGTNAFNPVCRNYKMNSLIQEGKEVNGQARCPFETKQTNVALFAEGNLYSATMADFLASDAVIYRSLGDRPVLRTVKYDSKWLKEPHFVHAIDYGHYVYFFFREIAIEYTALGRVVFSRVARVCKSDRGGSPRVLEKYWTSFLKVRLNCSVPGESFFYFDVLESMTGVETINGRPTVIGIFSTQVNSIPGSAVCTFYMEDIENSFNGRFKEQGSTDSPWIPVPEDRVPKPRPGCCAGHGEAESYKTTNEFPDESLSFIKSHPLLDDTVPLTMEHPWLTWTNSRARLSQVVVDTSAGPHQNYTVLFLATEGGRLLKVLPQTQTEGQTGPLLLEEIDVYNPDSCGSRGYEDRRPLAMELDKDHHALFLGFRGCVLRIPLSRCHAHGRCKSACIASRDPYCGWLRTGRCGTLHPGTRSGFVQDVERGHPGPRDPCEGLAPSAQDSPLDSSYGVQREKAPREARDQVHVSFLVASTVSAFLFGALISGLVFSWYRNRTQGKGRRPVVGGMEPEASLPKIGGKAEMEAAASRIYASLLVNSGRRCPLGREHPAYPELVGLPTPDTTPELPAKNLRPFRNQWDSRGPGDSRGPRVSSPGAYTQVYIPSAVVLPNNALGRQPSPGWPGKMAEELVEEQKARGLEGDSPPPPLPFRLSPKMVDISTLDELLQRLYEMNVNALGQAGAREEAVGPVAMGVEEEEEEEEEEEAAYHLASTLPRGGGARERPTQRHSLSTFPKTNPGHPCLAKHHSFSQARGHTLATPDLCPRPQGEAQRPPHRTVPRHGPQRGPSPRPEALPKPRSPSSSSSE